MTDKGWDPSKGKLGATGVPQQPRTNWAIVVVALVFAALIAVAVVRGMGEPAAEPTPAADSAQVLDTL